jgi:hypothetical protein
MDSTETERPLTFEQPANVEPTVATLPAPTIAAAAVTVDSPSDHGLAALMAAVRAREFALIDDAIVQESFAEIVAAARAWLQDLHIEDIRPGTVVARVGALTGRLDPSVLTSAIGGAAHGLTTIRPPRLPAPKASYPAKVRKIKVTPTVSPKIAAPRAPRRSIRVRWRRVMTRGLTLGLLAGALVSVPPEQYANIANQAGPVVANIANQVGPAIGNVANEVGPAIGTAANQVGTAIGEKLAAVQSGSGLARADFEVPPLSAYGAAFEAQAPYPTTRPSGTVEWVLALRNTGSAGWYRGIDGAQASVALTDGTTVAVQTTEYVGPGQVGWFVVRFPAPSQPGVSKIALRPRIDGRGPLPDLGLYVTVTVSPNP